MRQKLKAFLSNFWAKLNSDLGTLWNESKWFVFLFGAIVVAIKFKDGLVNFLISSGQQVFNKASQKADGLNTQENEDKEDAQQLIDDANKLPNNEPSVPDDWNVKKVLAFFLIFSICSNSIADCDWASIKKNADGTYVYTRALHLCVGKLVEDNQTKQNQIDDYVKALKMKDLSIQKADGQAKVWSDTASNLEGRLQKIDKIDRDADVLYFAAGILTAVLVGFSTARLVGK